MKIPKSFPLIGVMWTVEYKWNLRDTDGTKLDGLSVDATKTIFIERSLTKEEKELTFVHELIHSYINELIATGHRNLRLVPKKEEALTDNISRLITDKFKLTWRCKT